MQSLSTVLLSVLKLLHPLFSLQFIFWSGKLTISEMRDSPWIIVVVPAGDTRWCYFLLKWSYRCVLLIGPWPQVTHSCVNIKGSAWLSMVKGILHQEVTVCISLGCTLWVCWFSTPWINTFVTVKWFMLCLQTQKVDLWN